MSLNRRRKAEVRANGVLVGKGCAELYYWSTVSRFRFVVLMFALCLFSDGVRAAVDFNREVQPILSENCFKCHGPDEAARKGQLRLDTKAGALGARGAEDGPAIVPGDSAKSPLYQ